MDIDSSVFVNSTLSLVAGNLLGGAANRLVTIMAQRFDLTSGIGFDARNKSLIDNVLQLVLHVGIIGVGAQIVTNGMPWLTEDTSSFSLWILGLLMTSGKLEKNLVAVNDFFFLPLAGGASEVPAVKEN